jgi:hypothetical protein
MTPISARSRRPTINCCVDAIEQAAGLLLGQGRGFAAAHDVLAPAHGMGRIDGEDLADHQPVEQHADRREVQFDGRLGGRRLQHLYIRSDVHRLEVGQPADLVLLDPREKVTCGPVVGHAGVLVADRRGEKFKEALGGMVAGAAITAGTSAAPGAAATVREADLETSAFMAHSVTSRPFRPART